jgi:asparagine synthase (glutamine-hydrolysing)
MCGISGSINTDVRTIAEKQRHRGPDNFSVNQMFAHNRLSIIDLSENGNQPMTYGGYEITFNGEIYNYKELASYLHVNDDLGDFIQAGDTFTFLKYISKFGIKKALNDSVGMWAFGLLDKRENKIHLVVDRLGEKPLYYFQEGEVFAFSSSPAALLHLKDKWKINEQAFSSFWKLGATMYHSLWEGIKRVYASEHVIYDIETKTITTERYWQPEYKPNEDLRELIFDAIKKVKVSDVPVYIFLSGGIDSTLVASQFQNAIHMDGPELPYAKQVAERFDLNLEVVSPKNTDAVKAMTDYVLKCGEPSMSAVIPYLTSEAASKFCKVAVSANGADELFFGYDRTTEKVSLEQFNHIFRKDDISVHHDAIRDMRISTGRWFELQAYVQHDLNKTLDFASMAHGLEVRSPFLNHKLVEAALSTPKEKIGRKQILKDILKEFGFNNAFLNRPKQGFSLYQKPTNYDVDGAFTWAVKNGWLKNQNYSGRDLLYLKASAFSFKIWWETFKEKIH